MPTLDDDLRATADDIAADATRLAASEEEKTGLDAADPRMLALSIEGERLARRWPQRPKRSSTSRPRRRRPRSTPGSGQNPCAPPGPSRHTPLA